MRKLLVQVLLALLVAPGTSFGLSGHSQGRMPSTFPVNVQAEVVGVTPLSPGAVRVKRLNALTPRVNGLTERQRTTLREVALTTGDLQLAVDERKGTPFFLVGTFPVRPRHSGRFPLAADVVARLPRRSQRLLGMAETFLVDFRDLFQLDDPARELRLIDYRQDSVGFVHLKFQQVYQGIPVWGSQLIVHLRGEDEIYAVTGRYEPTPRSVRTVESKVSSAEALNRAVQDLARRRPIHSFTSEMARLLGYPGPSVEKVIFPDRQTGRPHLAWMITIRPNFRDHWHYFVDALSGEILFRYNATTFDGPATAQATDLNGRTQTINVYQVGATYYLIDASRPMFNPQQSQLPSNPVGAIWTIDARNQDLKRETTFFQVTSPNNTWTDRAAVSAHFNGGVVFEYFRSTHGRNAIDDKGSTIISIIHVTENSRPMDNAFWNGRVMAYGDGDRDFKPLAGALDVAAHEMTHGVTQYTANLVYLSQSGALDESMADVFGVMVDRDDLKLGEDVVKTEVFVTGALRDLENPNQGLQRGQPGWQPASMSEYVQLPEDEDHDNGGVHVNSGIPNRAAALIIKALGREKTERIYYRALTTYLTSRAQFSDARLAVAQAASDLFGQQSAEVTAVNQAFDAVGIGSQMTPPPPPPPMASGTQFIAFVQQDYTIGLVSPDGSMSISTNSSEVRHSFDGGDIARLSVPLNGRTIWFTADDGQIHFLDLSTMNAIEEYYIEGGIRREGDIVNVAVRPDTTFSARDQSLSGAIAITIGTALAPDPNVYVYDFTARTLTEIRLRVPTTGQGVDSETIAYADVLDWFADGKVLIYDAFNQVQQASGPPLQYWSFNLLRLETKDNLPALPPQPQGISVGNPQFASTTPLVVAYNEVEDRTGTIRLKVIDYSKSEIITLVDPGQANFGAWRPTFSPDDRKIAFVNITNVSDTPLFGQLLVGDLTTGNVIGLPVFAANPEWFARSP
ncbi:MAG TPA: M4 family metallopeptidase [Blastocatellia bacterium]|nr:M4 family metallopeptidase [Blastocatellia bacterium]